MTISKYSPPSMDELCKAFNLPGVHPAANLFPLICGEEFDDLCDSIGKDGLEQDIILTHDGMLLDGRNRLRACYVTGQIERFKKLPEDYASDYIGYVIRLNIHRRHLTPSQLATVALEAERLYAEEAKVRYAATVGRPKKSVAIVPQIIDTKDLAKAINESHQAVIDDLAKDGMRLAEDHECPDDETVYVMPIAEKPAAPMPKARDLAAESVGASPRYVQDAKKIKEEAPDIFEQVKSGEKTIPAAKREIKERKSTPRQFITLTQWKDEGMTVVPDSNGSATFNRQGDNAEDSMGNIEWASWSWNPVTGCKHDCSYCYARDIAQRFYTQGFEPSLHPDRLLAPYNTKVPKDADINPAKRNVFANSMSDLYGRWVPQEWIDAVFRSMAENPQWNFLTLTKFPKRAAELVYPKNVWIGTSVDLQARVKAAEDAFERIECGVKWLSIEPMIEPLTFSKPGLFDWVVIGGASRSTQTPEWTPPFSWIVRVASQFLDANPDVKIYLKTNGRPREFPGIITQTNAHDSFYYLGKKKDDPINP
jgi:protein gp37